MNNIITLQFTEVQVWGAIILFSFLLALACINLVEGKK